MSDYSIDDQIEFIDKKIKSLKSIIEDLEEAKKQLIKSKPKQEINNDPKKLYMTEKEVSQRYGMSVPWFQRKRWEGSGPVYIKVQNGRILYPIEATDKWFESFSQQNTSTNKKNNSEDW